MLCLTDIFKKTNNVFCFLKVQLLAERSEAVRAKISKMVVVIVLLFTICWGPIQLFILFQAFDSNFQQSYETYKLKIFAHCMCYSNSSVNPIVYAFMGANFRKSFKKAFPFIFKPKVKCITGAVGNTEMHFISSGTWLVQSKHSFFQSDSALLRLCPTNIQKLLINSNSVVEMIHLAIYVNSMHRLCIGSCTQFFATRINA